MLYIILAFDTSVGVGLYEILAWRGGPSREGLNRVGGGLNRAFKVPQK